MPKQEGPRGFEMRDSPESGTEADAGFTFASLVLSLSTSAHMHLGVAPRLEGDDAEKPEVNLPLAKQVIDILEMLVKKTEGNLDGDEHRLLEQALHDLHMRFVQVKRKA